MIAQRKDDSISKKWKDAHISPLRAMYYTYLKEYKQAPLDVYDLFKGYSFLILTRG